MNVHPLIHMADTMELHGYAVGTAHDALMREADGQFSYATSPRKQMEVVSAMQLAEYILSKRIAARDAAKLFPIPESTKPKITVRAKDPK